MKKIYVLFSFVLFIYGSAAAQLLLSTKFESQNIGKAYTRSVWQADGFTTGSWDSNLSERTQIDDSYSYSGEKSLRVAYPKGGYGPSQTGCQVDLKFDDRDEAYMSYWIRFSDDFSYGKTYEGGKLPGLGSGNTSGSNVSNGTNGFTARFMWRPGGQLVVLLYHMDFTDSMGEDQELTYPDGSIVHVPRGEWHHLAERVKTNTVTNGSANPDGELEVWIDGQQVLLRKGLRFRTNSDGINELYFSTFHGGGNADWSPTVDSYIWFDDIRIGTDYESVKMQTCTNPQLGSDKALCGSSVSLNAQCSETQAQYLTWYRDGEKIADKIKTVTASVAGTYTASYDSAWCAAKSTANVQNTLQVDLGDDQYLCSSSFATLESNVEGSSYKWQKDGVLLPNTTKSIQIKDAGTYKLTTSKSGCADASDEVTVTSDLLNIADVSGETGQSITLQSPTGGTINWYDNPSSSPLATAKTYTTQFPENEKYIYATDAEAFVGYVGKESITTGMTYHHNTNDFQKEKLKFTVYKDLTIDEITVFAFSSQNVTIRILDASSSNVVFTKTFSGVQANGATLQLNATLSAGTYLMDAVGSTGDLLYSHNKDVISFPYTISNVISITNSIFNNNTNTSNYAYFYNFKVHTGNTCAAAPIKLTGTNNGGGDIVLPDPDITVAIDANNGNRPISPYLYALNGYNKGVKYNSEDFASRVYEAGIHMTRQNSGNNSTKYNWRKKLTSHPNWYNNVHDEDWDMIAQTMQAEFPDIQGMFAFQLLGRVASSKDYNFPDWEYNKSQRWEGCDKNYAGNGSTPGDFKFTEGDVTLYTQEWPADSTAAIVTHWQDDLGLDMNQFLYWNMDNEVEIWGGTHDDVIKEVTDDVFEMYIQNYVATVKAVRKINPNIKICGPVAASEWDWYNPTTMQPTYKGKKYCWLEYVIMRLAEEEKKCGVKMLDVLDIHNYPQDQDVATMLQTHRLYWDENYDYPGANGVKKINGYWDNSITKEMVFVRCQNWIDKYFGKGYEVKYGISEYNIKSTDAMPTALAYAGNLGEGARHGMEYFMPWEWRTGMWETAHIFSRYAKAINVNTTSSDEELLSAYTSINESRDSMTVILVNRNESGTQIVQANISNFDCPDGTYDAYILANLPNGEETFVSHSQNALQKATATVSDGKMSISVPAYSITAVVLDLKDNTEKYAVTFVVDGETISSQRVAKGGNAVAPANPVKTGYTFINWDKSFTNITQNTTVTAIFEPIQYTVSFYDGINHQLIEKQNIAYGEDAVEPTIPTHEGYLFSHWDTDFTAVSSEMSVNAVYVERPSSYRYEAEDARVTNETMNVRESTLASNGKYADVRMADLAFDVVVESAGDYKLNIVYSLSDRTMSGDGSKYQKMYVNREEPFTYAEFPKTGSADPTFATIEFTIMLNRGLNVIEFLKSYGWIDMDYIEVVPLAPVYHTVTFVNWDNSIIGEPQDVANGQAAVAPEPPTREGYAFDGWDKDFSYVTEDLTVKATFVEKNKASYTVLDNAIASAEALHAEEYDATSWNALSTALSNAKAVERDLFAESQSIIDNAANALISATNNLVVKTFTVTFVVDGETISTQTITYGKSATAPTEPTKTGYTFVEWDSDFSVVTEEMTITAIFQIKTFTVTFTDYDGTSLKEETVSYGQNATAPDNPSRDGYTFSGWIGTFTNVTANVTVTASYTEIGKASYTVLDNAIASAEALPAEEYDEMSWSALSTALNNAKAVERDLSAESQSIIDNAANALISATNNLVVKTFTVTFVADGKSISTQTIAYGKSATAPTEPTKTGYTFVEWDSDFSVVTDEMTVTAIFQIKTFTVTFTDFDGTTLKEETVSYGQNATAPDNPSRDGYTFDGWMGTFTNVTANVTITASYTELIKASYVELDNAINSAEKLQESDYEATTWASMKTALNEAKSVDRNLYIENQNIVNQATAKLQDAINNLKLLDKTKLSEAISSARATILAAEGNIGDEVGQYPQSAVDVFSNAIQTANEVFENARNQNDINQQTVALNEAIQKFKSSVNQRTTSIAELLELIAEANLLLDNASVGENPGQYPLIEYIDLSSAKKSAENVADQENPSEQNIYTQVLRLEEAIEAFKNALILAIDDTMRQIKVYAVNNTIYVCQDGNDEIIVYGIDGRCIRRIARPLDNSTTEIFVENKGVYFVKVGVESFKVAVE